jgi:hypothetical protein
MKKNDKVILFNRGKRELGSITKKWMRKEVTYFNVLTERGIVLESLTTDPETPCYIDIDLSLKLNNKFKDKTLTDFTLEGKEEKYVQDESVTELNEFERKILE